MKKIILIAIMIAALGTAAFARDKVPAMEQKTLSGTLVVEYGQIALKAEDGLYYVRGLGQLAGFVDGLKEGAAVTLQGTVWAPERKHRNTRPETEGQKAEIAPRAGDSQGGFRVIRAEKISLNGKDYDLLTEGGRKDRDFNPWSKAFNHGPDRYMHRRPGAAPYHQFPNTRGPMGHMSGRNPDRRHMNGMHGSREWRDRRMAPRRW
ncbi:MAG: hypothetical protein LBL64_06835 [Treponema sp.]|jgi:opacity protein-like surface antigen|nr:hypothetical protein [Treponema sp.]